MIRKEKSNQSLVLYLEEISKLHQQVITPYLQNHGFRDSKRNGHFPGSISHTERQASCEEASQDDLEDDKDRKSQTKSACQECKHYDRSIWFPAGSFRM